MSELQENSKKTIERIVGLSTDKISKMSSCKFDSEMEVKLKKKLMVVSYPNKHLNSRGSVLISMGRLAQTEAIDKKIKMIAG